MKTRNGTEVRFWAQYTDGMPNEASMDPRLLNFVQGMVDGAEMQELFSDGQAIIVDFSHGRPYLLEPGYEPPEPKERPTIDTLKTSAGTPIRLFVEYRVYQPGYDNMSTKMLEALIHEADDFEVENPGLTEIIFAVLGYGHITFLRPDYLLPEQKDGEPPFELRTFAGSSIKIHCVSRMMQETLDQMPVENQNIIIQAASLFEEEYPSTTLVCIIELDYRFHMLLPGEELPQQVDEAPHAPNSLPFNIPGAVVIGPEDLPGLIEALTGRSFNGDGFDGHETGDEITASGTRPAVELPKLTSSKGTPITFWFEYEDYANDLARMTEQDQQEIIAEADKIEKQFPGEPLILAIYSDAAGFLKAGAQLPPTKPGRPDMTDLFNELCAGCQSTTCSSSPMYVGDSD